MRATVIGTGFGSRVVAPVYTDLGIHVRWYPLEIRKPSDGRALPQWTLCRSTLLPSFTGTTCSQL